MGGLSAGVKFARHDFIGMLTAAHTFATVTIYKCLSWHNLHDHKVKDLSSSSEYIGEFAWSKVSK